MGLRIMRNVKEVSQSQFFNDTLLPGGASSIVTKMFKLILYDYFSLLGGMLNKRKFQIYGWNCKDIILQDITSVLYFLANPKWKAFKYLGILFSSGEIDVEEWDEFFYQDGVSSG